MDYVMVQVAPLQPGLPRPRFSLYLSCQLQYGIVVVFHRQCDILLEDVHHTMERLLRYERRARIDMPEHDRMGLTLPDPLALLQEAEGAQDPFFGEMTAARSLPSPYTLQQAKHTDNLSFALCQCENPVTPQRPLVTRCSNDLENCLTASPHLITLKEKEQVSMPTAEFEGEELPEVTVKEIDLLMGQKEQFFEENEEGEREEERERTRDPTATKISIETLKDTVVTENMYPLDEDTDQPIEVQVGADVTEVTPPPKGLPGCWEPQRGPRGLCTDSSDTPPTRRSHHRCQLLFVDPHTQISQDAMRAQIEDPLVETVPLLKVLIGHLSHRLLPAGDLLAGPCTLQYSDTMAAWKKCAVLPSSSGKAQVGQEVDQEAVPEIGAETEVARPESVKDMKGDDSSLREVPRALLESGLVLSEASAASEIPLEESREDQSQELITPMSRCSPIAEAPVVMDGIPEEAVELPKAQAIQEELTRESILRLVYYHFKCFGKVSFHTLLPPKATRSTTANFFREVLELLSARKLAATQTGPYGSITVLPGPLYSGT